MYTYLYIYFIHMYVFLLLKKQSKKNEQTFTLRQKVKEKAWDLSSRVFVGIPDKKKRNNTSGIFLLSGRENSFLLFYVYYVHV